MLKSNGTKEQYWQSLEKKAGQEHLLVYFDNISIIMIL